MPRAANKVNTTDITNKINAFCLSVRVIRGLVAVSVVNSSHASSFSLSAVSTVDGNVLCLTSVNGLNRSPLVVVACLTALTLASIPLPAGSKEAV